MKNRRQNYFYAIAISLAFVTGCKSTSTGPGSSSTTVVTPAAGSYFLMRNETRDSTGALTSADTSMETFAQTGLSLFGKTNVIQIIDSRDGEPTDTGYIHYESNGDVTSYGGPDAQFLGMTGWMTIPFGSQTTITFTLDTTIDFIPTHVVSTLAGAGTGNVTINGKSFTTQKVTMTSIASSNFAGQSVTYTTTSTAQFAPTLGEVVVEDTPGTRNPISGELDDSSHDFVFNYVLK